MPTKREFLHFFNVDKISMCNAMVLIGITYFKEAESDLVFGFKNRLFKSGNMVISV